MFNPRWKDWTRTSIVARNDLGVVAFRLLQKGRRVDVQCRRSECDVAVSDELEGRLEAVHLALTVHNEVDVEVWARRHDLLRTLRVTVLSDHRRRRVGTVADDDEIGTVRTAAHHHSTTVLVRGKLIYNQSGAASEFYSTVGFSKIKLAPALAVFQGFP